MTNRLNKNALEFLRSHDTKLYGPIAEALNVRTHSIEIYAQRNSRRLTEYSCLLILSEAMGKNPNELIEEYADKDHELIADENK